MKLSPCQNRPTTEGYLAEVPFEENGQSFVATVWIDKEALKRLATILLEDHDPSHTTLEDLTAEVANFIVGHTKMKASDAGIDCTMSTPVFKGVAPMPEEQEIRRYELDGHCIALKIEAANG
jgi:hypothetical protein